MTKISQKDIDEGKIIIGGYLVGENDPIGGVMIVGLSGDSEC